MTITILDLLLLAVITGAVIYFGQRHLQEAKLTRELLQKLADDTLDLERADRPVDPGIMEAIRNLESPPGETTQPVVVIQRPRRANLLDGDPNERITQPPVISGITVQDILLHYTGERGAWPKVIREFYDDALENKEIASYFHTVDDPEDVQKHFTAVITTVNRQGLYRRDLQRMADKHRGVRNLDGQPITGKIYDEVIHTLANVLYRHGIPVHAVNALANTVKPLKDVIVVAS